MKNNIYLALIVYFYNIFVFIYHKKISEVKNDSFHPNIIKSKLNSSVCEIFKKVLRKYNSTGNIFSYEEHHNLDLKYAIFSMAYRYERENYYLFTNSLKKTGYIGDIFMFTNEKISVDVKQYLSINIIQPLFINEDWPYYSSKNNLYPIDQNSLIDSIPKRVVYGYFKFAMIRYSLLYVFLKKYGSKYKFGLMVDLKDIYFQLNPFSWNIPDGISLFEESRAISFKNSKANYKWVTSYNESLTHYKNYYIINSGQIYFTYPDILYFLEEYNRIILSAEKLEPEQAIFNIIYYSSNYPFKKITVFPNYFGPVRLLAGDALYMMFDLKIKVKNIKYKEILDYFENYILNCDYSIPVIVHFWYFSKTDEMRGVIYNAIGYDNITI